MHSMNHDKIQKNTAYYGRRSKRLETVVVSSFILLVWSRNYTELTPNWCWGCVFIRLGPAALTWSGVLPPISMGRVKLLLADLLPRGHLYWPLDLGGWHSNSLSLGAGPGLLKIPLTSLKSQLPLLRRLPRYSSPEQFCYPGWRWCRFDSSCYPSWRWCRFDSRFHRSLPRYPWLKAEVSDVVRCDQWGDT